MIRPRFAALPLLFALAACGGGETGTGQGEEAQTPPSGAAAGAETAEIIAEARACEGGEAGPFDFTADGLTALSDPLVYHAELSNAFMAAAREQACVFTLASGLSFRIDRAVSDETAGSPESGDPVTVHYEGKLISGQVFDSSYEREEPATFPSDRLIAGWVAALALMRVREAWARFIPADLAYGANPRPGGPIGPNAALTFRMELLDLPGAEGGEETEE